MIAPRHRRLISAILAGAVLGLGQVIPAIAASPDPPPSATLTAEPAVVMARVAPGASSTESLSLRAGQDLDISITPTGLGQTPEDGAFTFLEGALDRSPFSVRTGITVTPSTFHLAAGETRVVQLTVALPDGPAAGERFALLKVNGTRPGSDGNVGIGVALGVAILVTLPGASTTITGDLAGVNVGNTSGSGPLIVTGLATNTGDTHYGANPNVLYQAAALRDAQGNRVAAARQALTGNSIVPTFARQFELALDPGARLAPGNYALDVQIGLEDGTVLDQHSTDVVVPVGASPGFGNLSSDVLPFVILAVGGAILAAGAAILRPWRRRQSA